MDTIVKLYREKIEKIFSDVPPEHKFWLVEGTEINSLDELDQALRTISDEVFNHHVNDERNDFASWVKSVIKDEELADTLNKIKTKESTIKAVELRINSLRNLQSIHQAIDKIKDKIEVKEDKIAQEMPAPKPVAEMKFKRENFFTNPALYVGLLVGFVIGIVLGYFL